MSDWLTTHEAAAVLGTSPGTFRSLPRTGIRHCANAAGTRRLWFRPDLEAVQTIRVRCRVGITAAGSLWLAWREGRIGYAASSPPSMTPRMPAPLMRL